MDNREYDRWQNAGIRAVRQAAELCAAVQAEITPDVLQKKDRSPVTIADFGSQALICRSLEEALPEAVIVAEEDAAELREAANGELRERLVGHVRRIRPEAGADEVCRWIDRGAGTGREERFWTLDPIDGTKGFLRREQYAIALCLIEQGQLVAAVLACPRLQGDRGAAQQGVMLTAARGSGAFLQGLGCEEEPRRLSVSEISDPRQIRFCESVEESHSSHGDAARLASHLAIAAQPVRLDSQAKYAVVSRGQAEAYLRLPKSADYLEKIWDHAAGALIVSEAGGKVTDIHGRALDFGKGRAFEKNRGVVATNGRVHDEILRAIETLQIR